MKNKVINNLGLKVIALLFSVLLWLVVMNISKPIKTKVFYPQIVVTHSEVIENEGKTFKVVEDMKTIAVTVKAERSILERIKVENIIATADLREEQSETVPVRVKIEGFEGLYEEALPNPRNIQIIKEDTENKTFPITPIATGTLQSGYVIGELEADPGSIDISGPKSSLGRISKVVARVNVDGLSEDTTLEAAELIYYDAADNVIEKSRLTSNVDEHGVNVKVHLLETKEVEVKFDTSEIIPEAGHALAGLEIEPQKIVVSGIREDLEELEYIEVGSSALKQENLTKRTKVVVDIRNYLPKGITLLDSESSSVVVNILIEKEGLKNISIPVRSVVVNNVPSDMELSYGPSQDVELQFEGLEEVLAEMSAEKIAASIDLKNYKEEGTYDVPVVIASLPEGCSYLGNATIQITLTKK